MDSFSKRTDDAAPETTGINMRRGVNRSDSQLPQQRNSTFANLTDIDLSQSSHEDIARSMGSLPNPSHYSLDMSPASFHDPAMVYPAENLVLGEADGPRLAAQSSPPPRKPLKHKQLPLLKRLQKTLKVMILYVRTSRSLQFILLLFVISLILGILVLVFKDQLLPLLEQFATFVKANGVPAGILYIIVLWITCFPPMTGYSMLLTLSGFLFGVWWGFVVNYVGAVGGGVLCFASARELGKSYIKRSRRKRDKRDQEMGEGKGAGASNGHVDGEVVQMHPFNQSRVLETATAVDHRTSSPVHSVSSPSSSSSTYNSENTASTIDQQQSETDYERYANLLSRYLEAHPARSYKLLLLLRLAPYPYNIVNTLLAQIPAVTYTKFVAVTALGSFKLIIHAWIGSTLGELADIANPYKKLNDLRGGVAGDGEGGMKLTTGQIVEIVVLAFAVVFAIAGGLYLYRIVHKALKEQERVDALDDDDVSID